MKKWIQHLFKSGLWVTLVLSSFLSYTIITIAGPAYFDGDTLRFDTGAYITITDPINAACPKPSLDISTDLMQLSTGTDVTGLSGTESGEYFDSFVGMIATFGSAKGGDQWIPLDGASYLVDNDPLNETATSNCHLVRLYNYLHGNALDATVSNQNLTVPDFRGYFIRMSDRPTDNAVQAGIDPDFSSRTAASINIDYSLLNGNLTTQDSALRTHTHTYSDTTSSKELSAVKMPHRHSFNHTGSATSGTGLFNARTNHWEDDNGGISGTFSVRKTGTTNTTSWAHAHTVTISYGGTEATGQSSNETRPQNAGVYFYMKL